MAPLGSDIKPTVLILHWLDCLVNIQNHGNCAQTFRRFSIQTVNCTCFCLVNGGVPVFWWKKPCFKWLQNVSFKEPCNRRDARPCSHCREGKPGFASWIAMQRGLLDISSEPAYIAGTALANLCWFSSVWELVWTSIV